MCGAADSSDVVERAVELLVTGDHDPVVLPIAVLPWNPDRADLRPILERTFEDAGDAESLRGDRVLELALRWQCRQYRDGALPGRVLTHWAHGTSQHAGPPFLEPFELLDDDYDDGLMTEAELIHALNKAVDDFLTRSTVNDV